MVKGNKPHNCQISNSRFLIRLPDENVDLGTIDLVSLVKRNNDVKSIILVANSLFGNTRVHPNTKQVKGNKGIFSYTTENIPEDQIGQSGFIECKLEVPVKDTIDWVKGLANKQLLVGFYEKLFTKIATVDLFHAPTTDPNFIGRNGADVKNSHGVVRFKDRSVEADKVEFSRQREQLIMVLTSHLFVKESMDADFITWNQI